MLSDRGHQAGAEPGEKSQFDIVADGIVVFSKQREGRFPTIGEVLERLQLREQ